VSGIQIHAFAALAEVVGKLPSLSRALIDMPIGFPDGERVLDRRARAVVLARSSIFPVPCREALYAADYETACAINHRTLGKRLSRQSWNLAPKMRELDQLLQARPSYRRIFCECHPEICFERRLFATGRLAPKRTPEGRRLRLGALPAEWHGAIIEACGSIRRRIAAQDDIIDAAVLLLASFSAGGFITDVAPADRVNIPLRLFVPRDGLPTAPAHQ